MSLIMHEGPEVFVSLSSFGTTEVRRHGQLGFAALCADAGADGVEVRGELLSEASAVSSELHALGGLARERGLSLVYSSPDGLWTDTGQFDDSALLRALEHAQDLGAPRLKMSIGAYNPTDTAGMARMAHLLAILPAHSPTKKPVELVVENDQTLGAGTLPPLQAFFTAMQTVGLPSSEQPLGMTFDMGNWHWTGEDPLLAAQLLASRVVYVHCKGVQRQPHQWVAVPMAASTAPWRTLLRALPAAVPRAIEYPLQGDDLLSVTRVQVALVSSAEVTR